MAQSNSKSQVFIGKQKRCPKQIMREKGEIQHVIFHMQMTIYSKNLADNFADTIYKMVRLKPKVNENEYGKRELNYL